MDRIDRELDVIPPHRRAVGTNARPREDSPAAPEGRRRCGSSPISIIIAMWICSRLPMTRVMMPSERATEDVNDGVSLVRPGKLQIVGEVGSGERRE